MQSRREKNYISQPLQIMYINIKCKFKRNKILLNESIQVNFLRLFKNIVYFILSIYNFLFQFLRISIFK